MLGELINSLSASASSIFPLVLNLILVLFLLLVGLLTARGLGLLATLVLKAIKLESGAQQIGFNAILEKSGIKKSAADLLGDMVYWVVAFIVVVGVAGVFGLPVAAALQKVFAYMGIVFLAAFILGVGLFLASLISGIVRTIMVNFGLEGAKTASRIIYYIVIVFTFLAALAELGFSPDWTPHIGIILGMPALAAAIAFGLGCKDMAADFLHNLFKGK